MWKSPGRRRPRRAARAARLPKRRPQRTATGRGSSRARQHLQHLGPAGVGARSPSECLALQLRNHDDCAERKLALEIVATHLELLAARDYTRLKALTGADDEALRSAQRLILGLN